MATCRECGHTGGPAARFCTNCGSVVTSEPPRAEQPLTPSAPTPLHTGAGPRRTLVGVVVAAGVVVAGVIAAVALFGRSTTTGNTAADSIHTSPQEVTVHPTPVPAETPSSRPSSEPTDAGGALAELQRLRDADRAEVEALVGQWVPQLSAKRPGMVVNSIIYDYVEVLRDFHRTQVRYPDALLLFSGDYSGFRYGDFWITIVPRPQFDGPATNAWCDAEGIPLDDCYAKMISHTLGYESATELRSK